MPWTLVKFACINVILHSVNPGFTSLIYIFVYFSYMFYIMQNSYKISKFDRFFDTSIYGNFFLQTPDAHSFLD